MERNPIACAVLLVWSLIAAWFVASEAAAQRPGSPFGFELDVPPDKLPADLDEAVRLGAGWVRLTGQVGLDWQQVEPSPGRFNWAAVDRCVKAAGDRRLNVFVTVQVANRAYGARPGYLPRKLDAFTRFLGKAAERYDGDGVDDAPGSPVVGVWQIETELDFPGKWRDLPGNYATLLEASHTAIKDAAPRAKVAVAGMMGPAGLPMYGKILRNLKPATSFDIFDLHWNNTGGGSYRLQRWWHGGNAPFDGYYDRAQNLLPDARDTAVETWITEISASAVANFGNDQRTQAANVVYRSVYAMRKGAGAVFWVQVRDHAGTRQPTVYFDTTGLIDRDGQRKLAYYSYQLMTKKLAGCNRDNLEVIEEAPNLQVIKFNRRTTRGSRPIWVLWKDGLGSRTYTLALGSGSPVEITEAVPRIGLRRGSEIRGRDEVFQVTRRVPGRRSIELKLLTGVPVYVEPVE